MNPDKINSDTRKINGSNSKHGEQNNANESFIVQKEISPKDMPHRRIIVDKVN